MQYMVQYDICIKFPTYERGDSPIFHDLDSAIKYKADKMAEVLPKLTTGNAQSARIILFKRRWYLSRWQEFIFFSRRATKEITCNEDE